MRTGQRYIHKATFASKLSGTQLIDNIASWLKEVEHVAEFTLEKPNVTEHYIEYTAVGKWK